jgi:hypothetical protein
VSCHPGVVRTELGRYLIDDLPKAVLVPLAGLGWYFTKSPTQGAQTQVRSRESIHRLRDSLHGLRDFID